MNRPIRTTLWITREKNCVTNRAALTSTDNNLIPLRSISPSPQADNWTWKGYRCAFQVGEKLNKDCTKIDISNIHRISIINCINVASIVKERKKEKGYVDSKREGNQFNDEKRLREICFILKSDSKWYLGDMEDQSLFLSLSLSLQLLVFHNRFSRYTLRLFNIRWPPW